MEDTFYRQEPAKDEQGFLEDDEAEVEDRLKDEDELDIAEIGDTEHFVCDYCGEENEIFVDRTVASRQQFTEDCEVCCRPNLITIIIEDKDTIWIEAEREDDA